jgi:hypothetical protein
VLESNRLDRNRPSPEIANEIEMHGGNLEARMPSRICGIRECEEDNCQIGFDDAGTIGKTSTKIGLRSPTNGPAFSGVG